MQHKYYIKILNITRVLAKLRLVHDDGTKYILIDTSVLKHMLYLINWAFF